MEPWPPPFRVLSLPRVVSAAECVGFPAELVRFYERHEGYSAAFGRVGGEARLLEGESDDLCEEDSGYAIAALAGAAELAFEKYQADWEPELHAFRAVQIGWTTTDHLQILVVTAAVPGCHFGPGAVVLRGADAPGPEVHGQPMLVLGRSLAEWLEFLRAHGWNMLRCWLQGPAWIEELPRRERAAALRYERERNPGLGW